MHRRIGSIIWNPIGYGVPRTAIGTVDEGIGKASIAGFPHFAKALGTNGNVGGVTSTGPESGLALINVKKMVTSKREWGEIDRRDTGRNRHLGHQTATKISQRSLVTLDLDLDALRVIANKSTKPYTKSFAILFCILFEVVINIDRKKEVAFHAESCETLLANYFHHLCEVLQTGSIEEEASSSDFKELCVIVGLVQEDIATPSAHNKKTIDSLVSRACEN